VIVNIHGGGFLHGAGSKFGPKYLLDRDVILVTFNYRLGPLGKIIQLLCSIQVSSNLCNTNYTDLLNSIYLSKKKNTTTLNLSISKMDGIKVAHYYLLGWSGRSLPTFRRNLLPPLSG
jgi:hypothetical protein